MLRSDAGESETKREWFGTWCINAVQLPSYWPQTGSLATCTPPCKRCDVTRSKGDVRSERNRAVGLKRQCKRRAPRKASAWIANIAKCSVGVSITRHVYKTGAYVHVHEPIPEQNVTNIHCKNKMSQLFIARRARLVRFAEPDEARYLH